MSAFSREVGNVLAYRSEDSGEPLVRLLLLEYGATVSTELTQDQAMELSLALRDLVSPNGAYEE